MATTRPRAPSKIRVGPAPTEWLGACSAVEDESESESVSSSSSASLKFVVSKPEDEDHDRRKPRQAQDVNIGHPGRSSPTKNEKPALSRRKEPSAPPPTSLAGALFSDLRRLARDRDRDALPPSRGSSSQRIISRPQHVDRCRGVTEQAHQDSGSAKNPPRRTQSRIERSSTRKRSSHRDSARAKRHASSSVLRGPRNNFVTLNQQKGRRSRSRTRTSRKRSTLRRTNVVAASPPRPRVRAFAPSRRRDEQPEQRRVPQDHPPLLRSADSVSCRDRLQFPNQLMRDRAVSAAGASASPLRGERADRRSRSRSKRNQLQRGELALGLASSQHDRRRNERDDPPALLHRITRRSPSKRRVVPVLLSKKSHLVEDEKNATSTSRPVVAAGQTTAAAATSSLPKQAETAGVVSSSRDELKKRAALYYFHKRAEEIEAGKVKENTRRLERASANEEKQASNHVEKCAELNTSPSGEAAEDHTTNHATGAGEDKVGGGNVDEKALVSGGRGPVRSHRSRGRLYSKRRLIPLVLSSARESPTHEPAAPQLHD
ncbi:unnamed protein product, partial [Amoebophrya sp. A120]|eukprot:GSA120T00022823001.1